MRGKAHVYPQARIGADDIIAAASQGTSDEAVGRTTSGDLLEIDLQEGVVRNLTSGETFRYVPFTPFAMEVLEAGGLLPYVLRKTTGASSA